MDYVRHGITSVPGHVQLSLSVVRSFCPESSYPASPRSKCCTHNFFIFNGNFSSKAVRAVSGAASPVQF